MNKSRWVAFAFGFFCVGLPYWQIPYEQVSVPNSLYGFGLAVVFIAALWLHAFGGERLWPSTWVAGVAVPAVVLARTLVEVLFDPTSNNLWPLVLMIALVLGLMVALSGALCGWVLATLRR